MTTFHSNDPSPNLRIGGARVLTRQIRKLTARREWLHRRRAEIAGDAAQLGGVDTEINPEINAEIDRLADEIEHRRDHLAIVASTGSYQPWTYDHFEPGDFARVGGVWRPVLTVGLQALTLPPLELPGERRRPPNPQRRFEMDSATYVQVYGRRRAGRVLHTPPPPEDTTCTCRVIIPTFNAEFVPEQDAGPCPWRAVARLTVRHDGDSCGCHGLCLLADPDSATSALCAPWVEVVLFCRTHSYEYTATTEGGPATAAITFEELT